MSDVEIVELRHPAASSDEDREDAITALNQGIDDSGIARRPLIRNSMLGALGMLGLPAIVLLRDLGPAARRQARAHGLGARACASSTTSPAPRSSPRRSRSAS